MTRKSIRSIYSESKDMEKTINIFCRRVSDRRKQVANVISSDLDDLLHLLQNYTPSLNERNNLCRASYLLRVEIISLLKTALKRCEMENEMIQKYLSSHD